MALLFMDGFGGADTLSKWDPGGNFLSVGTATPRVSGCYYGITVAGIVSFYKTITASTKVFLGSGIYHYNTGGSYYTFFGDSGATQHISVLRNSSGYIEIRRGSGSGTLLGTGTTQIPNYTWFYVEISVTISDTVGEVHVRLNGQSTDEVAFVGDTKNGGTATTIDRIGYYNTANIYSWIADLYVLNSTGTTNNNFLGDVAVRTLSPSAVGTYSQLTNSAGNSTNNYTYVDEHAYSGTDYVGSATIGQRDTYALADLPAGVSSVYALQAVGYMAKSDASAASAKLALLTGGTLHYGTTRALGTSYQSYYDIHETNPGTSIAWTVADINGLEAGMEVA